jgi:hypothetical protein
MQGPQLAEPSVPRIARGGDFVEGAQRFAVLAGAQLRDTQQKIGLIGRLSATLLYALVDTGPGFVVLTVAHVRRAELHIAVAVCRLILPQL